MKLYTFIICLLTGCTCFAQNPTIHFMKNTGEYVSKKDSADFIRIVKDPAAGTKLYSVMDFYTDGKGKMEGTTSRIDPIFLEGQSISYYHNGNRQKIVQYKKNQIIGDEFTYYPNGKLYTVKTYSKPDSIGPDKKPVPQIILIKTCSDSTGKSWVTNGVGHYIGYDDKFKNVFEQGDVKDGMHEGEWTGYDTAFKLKFTEKYENGKLITGASTDSVGNKVYYTQRAVTAQYKGGIDAFYTFLSRTIRYPGVDRENNRQGTVIFRFVIDKRDGLKKITCIRSVSPTIDAEALRVIGLSSDSWLPGYYLGKQINQQYTVPINFTLAR